MEKIGPDNNIGYRNRLSSICFTLIFISLLYSFFSHTLVTQLDKPVLKFPGTDITYWLFHFLRIPEYISGNRVAALTFDILLTASCGLALGFPGQRQWPRIFFVLYFVYFIIYNSYGMHHVHSMIGILLLTVPFMLSDERGFCLLWQGLRYYTCFIYASACCWKLIRGSWLNGSQGILILRNNLTAYLFYNPHSSLAGMYHFLLQHSIIPDLLTKAGFLMEGVFIVGFFTRRFDKYLFVLAILLPLGFLLMADALFFEIAFLAIVFYRGHGVEWPAGIKKPG